MGQFRDDISSLPVPDTTFKEIKSRKGNKVNEG